MNYGLKKPCASCPFVEANDFPLDPERIEEIAEADGFACHNTVDYDAWDEDEEGYVPTAGEHHCYGHLVIQWAQHTGFLTVTAWAAREGAFDPTALPEPSEVGCFESFEDYVQREEER